MGHVQTSRLKQIPILWTNEISHFNASSVCKIGTSRRGGITELIFFVPQFRIFNLIEIGGDYLRKEFHGQRSVDFEIHDNWPLRKSGMIHDSGIREAGKCPSYIRKKAAVIASASQASHSCLIIFDDDQRQRRPIT